MRQSSGMAVWLALSILCCLVTMRAAMAQGTDTLTIGYVEISGGGLRAGMTVGNATL